MHLHLYCLTQYGSHHHPSPGPATDTQRRMEPKMKATQVKVEVYKEPAKKCVICGSPTQGWGRVANGWVCGSECQIAYDVAKAQERSARMMKRG